MFVSSYYALVVTELVLFFFFQAEDGIRDLVRSRGLGDVYKRQPQYYKVSARYFFPNRAWQGFPIPTEQRQWAI